MARDQAVLTLLYGCGLRISEALTLTTAQAEATTLSITGKGNMWSIWAGYRFWHNKFGIDPNPFPQPGPKLLFTVESTWLTGTTWAF